MFENEEFEKENEDLKPGDDTHGVDTAFYDRSGATPMTEDNQQLQHANDILNEYNVFSPGDLQKLALDQSIEGREKLKEIAEKYDIIVDDGVSSQEIVDIIINRMNSQDAPDWFMGSE